MTWKRPIRTFVSLTAALALAALAPSAWAENVTAKLLAASDAVLALPHDLTLTPDGRNLVVADMGHDRVVLLNPGTLALEGVIGEGVMSFPHDVAFDVHGRLLVADSGNDRILIYTVEGLQARLIEAWDDLRGVEGVAAAPDGSVYAALVEDNAVARLEGGKIVASTTRALGMSLDRPHDVLVMATESGLEVIASDPGNHRLIVFNANLAPMYEISTWDPPFTEPKYISRDEAGRIYVADQYNNRIRVFNAEAQELGGFAQGDVKLPEGVLAQGGKAWVSDTERGRVLLYRLEQSD